MKNLFSRQKNINSKDPEYILHQYLYRIAKEKYLDFDEKVQKLRQKFLILKMSSYPLNSFQVLIENNICSYSIDRSSS